MTYFVVLEFEDKAEAQDAADVYAQEFRGAFRAPDPNNYCTCYTDNPNLRDKSPEYARSSRERNTGWWKRNCCGKVAYTSCHMLVNLRQSADPDELITLKVWTRPWKGKQAGDKRK